MRRNRILSAAAVAVLIGGGLLWAQTSQATDSAQPSNGVLTELAGPLMSGSMMGGGMISGGMMQGVLAAGRSMMSEMHGTMSDAARAQMMQRGRSELDHWLAMDAGQTRAMHDSAAGGSMAQMGAAHGSMGWMGSGAYCMRSSPASSTPTP